MERKLGKLESIDLRELWPDEAQDFTPWLSSEGLELLGETIGAQLVLVKSEAGVGPYSADILAEIEGEEEHYVVIENQLGRTDHDHLGKTITYAAGLGARTVIWIASEFTEEHRQALDWLNNNTESGISFFALEVELLKIGDSLPAPQFKIISSPNDWAKAAQQSRQGDLSETKIDQQHFWQELADYMKSQKSFLRNQKAQPQHWTTFALGRSNFNLSLTVNSNKSKIGCEVFILGPQAKHAFDLLLLRKTEIEAATGYPLEWQKLENKVGSRIVIYRPGTITDSRSREEAKVWMHQTAELFHRIFSPRISALDLDSEENDEQ